MKKVFIFVLFCLTILVSKFGFAEVFSYRDDSGKRVFVDRLEKVPEQYRHQLDTLAEEKDKLAPEEQKKREAIREIKLRLLDLVREKRNLIETIESASTPFTSHGNSLAIWVKLKQGNYTKTVSLLLDTGASSTVLFDYAAEGFVTSGSASYAQIADGSLVKLDKVVIDHLSFGPIVFDSNVLSVIAYKGSSGFGGLLGMDVLASLDYQVDYAARKIYWEPKKIQSLKEKLAVLELEESALKKQLH